MVFLACFGGFPETSKASEQQALDKKTVNQSVNGSPAVDILFIIDNSGSMWNYQQRLMVNARSFVNYFSDENIDYHIGVTTSSTNRHYPSVKSRMAGISYISRTTSKAPQVKLTHGILLSNMVDVGVNGSRIEQFLSIPELNLTHSNSAGFLRSEAHLAIFVITDSDDQSEVSPQQAYQYLLDLKGGDQKKLHYAAALVFEEGIDCEFDQPPITIEKDVYDVYRLIRVKGPHRLTRTVGLFSDHGYSFDLCNSDYDKELANIAQSIVDSILTEDGGAAKL